MTSPCMLGEDTMPDYYNRALQTEQGPLWNFTRWLPDLVPACWGKRNDFNKQKMVPFNTSFFA